jgi:hypothetical protein
MLIGILKAVQVSQPVEDLIMGHGFRMAVRLLIPAVSE